MRNDAPSEMYGITNNHRLGHAIRALRKERRITQADLASTAGVSRLCLRDLETGARSVGAVNQFKVLNALGYEVALLPKASDLDHIDIWDTTT